jgi:hypothetical protein
MQPEPVEQALAAASDDDTPENRAKLFQLLLRTELLVPAVEEPEEELVRMTEEGEELDLLYLEPGVMAVYIDVEHLLESVPEGCGYIGMSGHDLFRLAADNAVTRIEVNPASATRATIEGWEIEALTSETDS